MLYCSFQLLYLLKLQFDIGPKQLMKLLELIYIYNLPNLSFIFNPLGI